MTAPTIAVMHGTCTVPVHDATAWAFGLTDGESVTDADLRRLVHCTWFVDKVEERFAAIVFEAGVEALLRKREIR